MARRLWKDWGKKRMHEIGARGLAAGRKPVAVIGAGFAGLAAAYELALQGFEPIVFEGDPQAGGLAASFLVNDKEIERFYHFWYNNDPYLLDLVNELDLRDQVVTRPSPTGMYFAGSLFRLTTPWDVLRFKPLSLVNRLRLGWLVLAARRIKSWRELDHISAADWLKKMGGKETFRVVWEPLLVGKFGKYAYDVSAAWFWAKLVLRGASRNSSGAESLMYFKGGFKALVDHLVKEIQRLGGQVRCGTPATRIETQDGTVKGVHTSDGFLACDAVIATPALPIVAGLLGDDADPAYRVRLRQIKYLGNVCLILELDRSLSDLFWMNVNDPSFPFVAVIEHTNMDPMEDGSRHIVYLSKYLPVDDPAYTMGDAEFLDFTLPHLKRMFPEFSRKWIRDFHIWRAEYTQPLATVGYADLIPANDTPIRGLKIASMAQIYPEDRGTPHAVREGRAVARKLAQELRTTPAFGGNEPAAPESCVVAEAEAR